MDSTNDSNVRAIRDKLLAQRNTLVHDLERVQSDLQVAERMMTLLANEQNPNGHGPAITVEDVQHCRTQKDLAKRFAELNGGVVRIKEAGRLAFETGRWQAKQTSLNSTLYNLISNSPEWEWEAPGTFRLRK